MTELVDVALLAVVVVLVQSAHTADLWKSHESPVLKTTPMHAVLKTTT